MKRWVAMLGAIVALVIPVSASAASSTVRTYGGITCTWHSDTHEGVVLCRLATGTGLATIVSRSFVAVRVYRTAKVVWWRNQPSRSPGYGALNDKRIFHSEQHRGIVCYWSRIARGSAFCARADRHGYVAGVSHLQAIVLNESSRIAFLRNQP